MASYLDIVHLSDLHLRSDPTDTAWVGAGPQLGFTNCKTEALVAYLDAHHPQAHIAITGDITHHGTSGAYMEARRLLGHWMEPRKLSVVMGNHDRGTLGNIRFEQRAKAFKRTFSTTVSGRLVFPWVKFVKHVALIGLDSTAEGFLARGKIGDVQLWRLHDILNRPAVRKRVVMLLLHHHVFTMGPFVALHDAAALMEVVRGPDEPRVDAILFGHKHHAGYWKDDIHYVAAASSVATQGGKLRFDVIRAFSDGKLEVIPENLRVDDRKVEWEFSCPDCAAGLIYQGVLTPTDVVDCPDCGCTIDLWSARRFLEHRSG